MSAPGYLLVVMNPSGVVTVPLPAGGEVTLGRGDDCEVQIDDKKLSRRHAIVRAGAVVEVIDLGSMNGTFFAEKRLEPNIPLTISAGAIVTMGSTAITLQRALAAPARALRVWSQSAFHARLEEERARARRERKTFCLLRVRFELSPVRAATAATVRDDDIAGDARRLDQIGLALQHALRDGDVIASDGVGCYEILLPETPLDVAHAVMTALEERARDGGVRAEAQLEVFPERAPPSAPPPGGAMSKLTPVIERVASGMINVLILGETGVGKEVAARTIHERSPRAKAPLLCLNCAAFSEALLESELFGHEKGAFTGAVTAKAGLLESAQGGTVFLDEVGEMPLSLQAKFLRVLEQREVLRVGSLRPRAIDVRFVSATNRDLEEEIAAGRFRQDLFFRLNAVSIRIPPLRERLDEIEPLVRLFAARAAEPLNHATPTVAAEVMDLFSKYAWPGNIRELKNVVERAVLFAGHDEITLEHLPLDQMVRRDATAAGRAVAAEGDDERQRIVSALEQCAGNQTHAAKVLGISRRTLVQRLADHAIPRPRKR